MEELDAITDLRDAQRSRMEELKRSRLHEFMTGFSVITLKLKQMYQMITLGGDAELELVDSLDPFSEGIVFRSVRHRCERLCRVDTCTCTFVYTCIIYIYSRGAEVSLPARAQFALMRPVLRTILLLNGLYITLFIGSQNLMP